MSSYDRFLFSNGIQGDFCFELSGMCFTRCHNYFSPFFVMFSILMGGLVFGEYHTEPIQSSGLVMVK